jgi:hypothetical protein
MDLAARLREVDPNYDPSKPAVADWISGAERPAYGNGSRSRAAVKQSGEVERVLALPRRPQTDLDTVRGEALVELMTSRLRRHRTDRCDCLSRGRPCITKLRPAQAWALFEAPQVGGLDGLIGVGHGKTALNILMPLVMPGCKLAVVLIKPGHQETLMREYLRWREHFIVPSIVMGEQGYHVTGRPVLHVVPYSILSRPSSSVLLEQLKPDLVIADEAQNLRHRAAARTARLLRLFAQAYGTRLCWWTGSAAKDSITNVAHLSALALGTGSPLPIDPDAVDEWAAALDPTDNPAPAGALRVFMQSGDSLARSMRRRLVETRGVVATKESAIDASINLYERKPPPVPQQVAKLLKDVRETWTRPDGEEFVDALEVARCLRQLACGFYYRWKYPRGEHPDLIDAWFRARKDWHKELRKKLEKRLPHLDSPMLCTNAAIRHYRGTYDPSVPIEDRRSTEHLPRWAAVGWPAWREIKDQVQPETETVWIDDYLARDAAEWAREHRGIVWYEFGAFGKKVAEISQLARHGGGPDAERLILAEDGKSSIIASIKSHGTGRDGLQFLFNEQLIANPPSSGEGWEQLFGRLHREGQRADEVDSWVYRHTPEMRDAIDRAVIQAHFAQDLTGADQKLLSAACDFELA